MHPSVRELGARVRGLPDVIRETLARPLPEAWSGPDERRLVLAGIGASEAVARYAEAVLRHELGLDVGAVPVSSFVAASSRGKGARLCVLSQQLSPNAELALARAGAFDASLLLTSLEAADARLDRHRDELGAVWTLPPAHEDGLLVRVLGPVAAALALVRLGRAAAGLPHDPLDALPRLVGDAIERGFALAASWPESTRRAPLLACGWYARALEPIAWSWMETWFVEAPPTWDVLQVAHGPWQTLCDGPQPLVLLRRPDDPPELWERLDVMIGHPGVTRRSTIELHATLPGGLAMFEHLGAVLGLLVGVLERGDLDLTRWPGRGTDAPLYDLGRT
jgi:hypothetical protein